MSRLWIIPVCLTLAGCGGGGGSSVSTWLKSEPAPADKSSQQLAQLGASDIPELPRIQTAANTSAPQRAGSQQSLPAVDMSKSWSTSVEAAPLDDLPPLPMSGSTPTTNFSETSAPITETNPSRVASLALPSLNYTASESVPILPSTTGTAAAPKGDQSEKTAAPAAETTPVVAQLQKPVAPLVETPAVASSSAGLVADPYAGRTAAYLATNKTVAITPAVPGAPKAALPSVTASEGAPVTGHIQSEALPGLTPMVKPTSAQKALAQTEKSPDVNSKNAKRYLVFASFNESGKAEILARRHAKLGATVLSSEVGGAQVYRVAVPVGKSAANKRRDLTAAGLTDAWPLRM